MHFKPTCFIMQMDRFLELPKLFSLVFSSFSLGAEKCVSKPVLLRCKLMCRTVRSRIHCFIVNKIVLGEVVISFDVISFNETLNSIPEQFMVSNNHFDLFDDCVQQIMLTHNASYLHDPHNRCIYTINSFYTNLSFI